MKKWFYSKTVWINIIAAIAGAIQLGTGTAWIDVEAQAAIIVVINLILRMATNQGLTR